MARDWAAAKNVLRDAWELATASGAEHIDAALSPLRARTMLSLGYLDDAETLVQAARDGAAPESRPAQARWRSIYATILAARGDADAAVDLATEATRLLRNTDLLWLRADVCADLATALHARGDAAEGRRTADQARVLYERKGNTVAARGLRNAASLLTDRA